MAGPLLTAPLEDAESAEEVLPEAAAEACAARLEAASAAAEAAEGLAGSFGSPGAGAGFVACMQRMTSVHQRWFGKRLPYEGNAMQS